MPIVENDFDFHFPGEVSATVILTQAMRLLSKVKLAFKKQEVMSFLVLNPMV